MTTSRIAPLAALGAALTLAACGSSSSGPSAADARAAYAPIKTQVVSLGTDIGTAIGEAPKETDAQLATQFDALSARGRKEKAALDALQLPDSVVAARNALRDALRKGTDDLSDIATAAKASDAAAARTAAEKLVADSEQIRTTRAAFEQALSAAK
jgi:hypothetical protein